ncbi:MAG TPA: ABC transporter permease [Burkholderiales bacterium]|nr:ABC transporter permease [Burkholderiales bacterium]
MPALILGRLVLVEARRGGLVWLAAAALLAGIALSAFLAQLAITESRPLQAAVVAALLRVSAVFLLAAQLVASVRREIDDRRLELMLALPLSRAVQYLGRLAGFIALGAILAIVFALPLLLWAAPRAVLAWGLSLAFELALVAAAALFFAMSLGQLVSALAATAGLYLLARSIGAIQAIAAGPLAEATLAHELARRAVDGVALALPALDRVTRTEWLLYGTPDGRAYLSLLGGLLVYIALLTAAGIFDFARRAA